MADTETYRQAVERAGVIELPDAAPTRRGQPPELVDSLREDREPPVVSR